MTPSAAGHPRRLELERLAMGEQSEAQAHVAGCPECSAAVAELAAQARAFVARTPATVLLDRLSARRQPWWRRWAAALVLVPATAALVLFFARSPEPEARLKGSGLEISVTRAGMTAPLLSSQRPRPGDRLTFVFQAPAAGHLILVDVERGRAPAVFFPFGAQGSAPIPPGRSVLPDAVELDSAQEDEWLLAVFSTRALSLAEVTASLDGGVPTFSCEGCAVELRTLTRERP